jgi:uncharacterized protein
VAVLRRHPADVQHECRQGPIADLAVSAARVPAGADVLVDVDLEAVHGGVMAHGTVEAPWDGDCRRCAGQASGRLVAEVRELFEERGDPETSYPLQGDQLDLEPLARDAVLLELPQAPLCKEDCLGLCPSCGADRNTQECDCPSHAGDPRWAALDALRTEL